MQYELNNVTEDADYDDGNYDSTYTGTTDYFIMTNITIDEDDEGTSITEVIADMKNDINSLENGKQDKLTAGENIAIDNNVISATVDVSDYYTKEEIDENFVHLHGPIENIYGHKVFLNHAYFDFWDVHNLNDNDKELESYLNEKANISDVYTKEEVDEAIENNEMVIAASLNDLNDRLTEVEEKDAQIMKLKGLVTSEIVDEEEILTYHLNTITYSDLIKAINDGVIVDVTFFNEHDVFLVGTRAQRTLLNYFLYTTNFIYVKNVIEAFHLWAFDITEGPNDSIVLTQHSLEVQGKVDLSKYYTKSEVDEKLGDIETLLSNI